MLNIDRNEKMKELTYYGLGTMSEQLIEEMSELTQAICKYKRYNGKGLPLKEGTIEEMLIDNLIEELADVSVALEEVIFLTGCRKEIEKIAEQKVNRAYKRMKEQVNKEYKKIKEKNIRKTWSGIGKLEDWEKAEFKTEEECIEDAIRHFDYQKGDEILIGNIIELSDLGHEAIVNKHKVKIN